MTVTGGAPASDVETGALSLYRLLDPDILANPYPLYRRLREEDPVHWDPYLHAWVVTRYDDAVAVFKQLSAARTPPPDVLDALGLGKLAPVAQLMVRQMLFLDPPLHTRVRGLAAQAFSPRRVQALQAHIAEICESLLDEIVPRGRMEVIADLAFPLPAIVTEELLGVSTSDRWALKTWSEDFAEMLGNFQHNPDRIPKVVQSVNEMTAYFEKEVAEQRVRPREGLITALINAEIGGDRLSDEEVVANTIITMVGGQETTTNLIGNGLLTLLRHPDELERLRADPSLMSSAIEELLRYESPSQHTARLAPEDTQIGGRTIRKRQAVIASMGAANRDPQRFADPDRLDLGREDNRHLAFGWASHFCFGAPLARMEGQIAFGAILRRMPDLQLAPQELEWRTNLGLRGLTRLDVTF
jgi:pimeloyl-[acyl-carrier protein] synthase